jgi:hypothetical protein
MGDATAGCTFSTVSPSGSDAYASSAPATSETNVDSEELTVDEEGGGPGEGAREESQRWSATRSSGA